MGKTQILQEGKYQEKCKSHGDLMEYFCPRCEEAICVTCTCDPQHEEHCDQIVDLKTGLKELKASMNKLCETFKDNVKKVEICSEILKQDVNLVEESKKNLSAQCQEMEKVLNQMKNQLKIITEFDEPLVSACQDVDIHLAVLRKQMSEFQNLNQATDGNFIQKSRECRLNCERIMFETEEILKRKLKIPENMKQNITIIGEVVQVKTKDVCLKVKVESKFKPVKELKKEIRTKSEKEQKQGARNPFKNEVEELENIQLMKEIKPGGSVEMRNPLEVVSVGDGTVIVIDEELNYLQRINTEGEVVRKYQVTISQQVTYNSACVFGNYLFVLTSGNVITKMSLDVFGGSIKYKPEGVGRIDYISAIGDNDILISEGGYPFTILEYNTETNKVLQRVSDIGYPGKVNVVQAGHHTEYIVKWYNPLSGASRVKIYNRDWNQISTIDINPDALTVTPGGKLLIVYNNRIHEYSQEGRLIRELLHRYKFNKIRDITWSGGCLWVLERDPHSLKIFVSN